MVENIYRKLIIRELKGEVSTEESQIIDKWIKESPENQKLYNELWSAFQLTSPDVELFIPDKEIAWANISNKISVPLKRRSLIIQLSSIAAAAVIFFLIGFAIRYSTTEKLPSSFLNQYSTVVVPEGQKSMIILPDGSQVWLNSGTVLKYKSSFNSQIREVEITGEGYFEVTKDNSRKFRVNTGKVSVEVYGTAFNIRNYKEDKKLEVTVERGRVGLVKEGNKLTELTKGGQALINEGSDEMLLSNVKVDVVTAWRNNELIFNATPLEELTKYLERWYGVNITIEEKMKKKHNYTFKVKTESLRELLELLKVITPLQYKIDGKNVTIRYSNQG